MRRWIPLLSVIPLSCIDASVSCQNACPDGTTLAAQQIRIDSFQLVEDTCTATCDPIQPCLPPNLPVISSDGKKTTYRCEAIDGYGDVPAADEVQSDFGQGWVAIDAPETGTASGALSITTDEIYTFDDIVNQLVPLTRQGDGQPTAWFIQAFYASLAMSVDGATVQVLPAAGYPVPNPPYSSHGRPLYGWDLDGDGLLDHGFPNAPGAPWLTCVGDGLGGVTGTCNTYDPGIDATKLWFAGDADNDGDDDALVSTVDGLFYVPNNGASLGPAVSITGPSAQVSSNNSGVFWDASPGDLNHDGFLDVLVRDRVHFGGPSGWTTSMPVPLEPSWDGAAALADPDGDGFDAVLAIQPGDSGVEILTLEIDGGVIVPTLVLPASSDNTYAPGGCARVDWDGDGRDGLACQNGRLVHHVGAALVDGMVQVSGATLDELIGGESLVLEFSDGPAFVFLDFELIGTDSLRTHVFRSTP